MSPAGSLTVASRDPPYLLVVMEEPADHASLSILHFSCCITACSSPWPSGRKTTLYTSQPPLQSGVSRDIKAQECNSIQGLPEDTADEGLCDFSTMFLLPLILLPGK